MCSPLYKLQKLFNGENLHRVISQHMTDAGDSAATDKSGVAMEAAAFIETV